MKTHRKAAIIVGTLILVAYAAVIRVIFESEIIIFALFEVMGGIAVIAIAVFMSPLFKPYNQQLTFGYLICKIIEGVALMMAGMLLLSPNSSLLVFSAWITMYDAYIFIPASLLFYWLLYQSLLVPRFISIWGVFALIVVFIVNVLEITGRSFPMTGVFYLPFMTNEIFLAIWLIVKGFNPSAIASESG